MAQYKYYIEMNYINGETNKEIKPENIQSFFIDSNFEIDNMPMMYVVLVLDKNFYDDVIQNAKVATIQTNIYKISTTDTTDTKTLTRYKGVCSYFISGDINYNKEIDYTEAEANKKDVYREVHIGLIYKECIDYNKQTNNTAIVNTTMLNAVASYMQRVPLLIENFTYNDIISQLIIPPKDSLYKTVDFLNSIKVFYSTPYRFFIEPGCVYLISSSGKPTQKVSEKYSTVVFRIHSIVGEEANVLGMMEDESNNFYSVDVNVLDTHYTIDNDTCKTVNKISSIINPSKDNSLISSSSIQSVMNDVLKIKNNILASIHKKLPALKNIPYSAQNIKIQFATSTGTISDHTDTTVALVEEAITTIVKAPLSTGPGDTTVGAMTPEAKEAAILSLTEKKNNLKNNRNKINALNADSAKSANAIIGGMGKTTTNMPSLLNSITAININDNISAIQKLSGIAKTESAANTKFINDTIVPQINTGENINSNMRDIHSALSSLGLAELKDVITSIADSKTAVQGEVSSIIKGIKGFSDITNNMDATHSSITPSIKNLDSIKVNLKSQFTNQKIDIQNASGSGSGTLANIIGSGSNVLDILKSKGLSLSTLSNISKDINKVLDISQIGKIGVSNFNVNLAFQNGVSTGSKIVKIDNDNTNKLKNIKASMENKANRLTINKNDLDISVFTINKEYIVKNYDAHSNKDGRFLLSRKVEIFLRQDDKFVLNTMLEFDKLADESKPSSGAVELGKEKNTTITAKTVDIDSIVKNATAIINSIKSKNNVKNLIKDATSITKEYKQLKVSATQTSRSLSSIIEDTKMT